MENVLIKKKQKLRYYGFSITIDTFKVFLSQG